MMRLARRAALFVALSLLTSAASGYAVADAGQTAPSCSFLHTARPDSAYAFTQASLIALSYAQSVALATVSHVKWFVMDQGDATLCSCASWR